MQTISSAKQAKAASKPFSLASVEAHKNTTFMALAGRGMCLNNTFRASEVP